MYSASPSKMAAKSVISFCTSYHCVTRDISFNKTSLCGYLAVIPLFAYSFIYVVFFSFFLCEKIVLSCLNRSDVFRILLLNLIFSVLILFTFTYIFVNWLSYSSTNFLIGLVICSFNFQLIHLLMF